MKTEKYILFIFSSVGLIAFLFIILGGDEFFIQQEEDSHQNIGHIVSMSNTIKYRHQENSIWKVLVNKDAIRNNIYLFTEKDAKGTYRLFDGTELDQAPETMLYISKTKQENQKEGNSGNNQIDIKVNQGELNLYNKKKSQINGIVAKDVEIKIPTSNIDLNLDVTDEGVVGKVFQGQVVIKKNSSKQLIDHGEKFGAFSNDQKIKILKQKMSNQEMKDHQKMLSKKGRSPDGDGKSEVFSIYNIKDFFNKIISIMRH